MTSPFFGAFVVVFLYFAGYRPAPKFPFIGSSAIMIEPPISILKTLWSRGKDGEWGVSGLKPIKLKAKPGHSPRYFEIDSEFELMTQNPRAMPLAQLLSTFGSTDFLMKQSIFPVVAWLEGDREIRVVGTAAAVSCSGYLLTAAHVVLDPLERGWTKEGDKGIDYIEGACFGVLMPASPASGYRGFHFFRFERTWTWGNWKVSPLFHVSPSFEFATDLAICKIAELPSGAAHQPLCMSRKPFVNGEEAYAIGYAEMKDIPIEYNDDGRLLVPDFPAKLYVSIGRVEALYYPTSTERNPTQTPGPCFELNAKIPGGMSGSPIFGANGAVVRGVISSAVSDGSAHGSMLGPVMELFLDDAGSTLRSYASGEDHR